MGKLLIEYALPTVLLFLAMFYACELWFFKFFPRHIKTVKTVDEKSEVYDHELGLDKKEETK